MSDAAKSKIAMDCFNRGSEAIRKGNFDYAIENFLNCAKLVPDNLTFRQALRGAERKQYKDNKKGASMAGLKMKPAQMKLQYAKRGKKWLDVIEAAEEALKYNPWDASTLYELGNAASELGYLQMAIWVLETAHEADRQRADIMRLLASLYEQDSQFDRAITAWETVKKIDPTDQDAAAKARQLAAAATIQRGKYDSPDSFRETMRDAARPTDQAASRASMSAEDRAKAEIAELETKLAADPASVNLWVTLGDKYRNLNQTEKALAAYQKGLDATGGGDLDLKGKILECQIDPFRRNVQILKERRGKLDPNDPEARDKALKLQGQYKANLAEIIKREIELYRFKTEVNPQDYPSYFELGHRLLRVGRTDDAIKALQQGRNDALKKWEALFWLGYAFWQKKNFTLAEKNLADAQAELNPSNEDGRKRVIYHRGRVAEEKGDLAAALGFYNEVAAIDYGYEDVSGRLDTLNAKQPAP